MDGEATNQVDFFVFLKGDLVLQKELLILIEWLITHIKEEDYGLGVRWRIYIYILYNNYICGFRQILILIFLYISLHAQLKHMV